MSQISQNGFLNPWSQAIAPSPTLAISERAQAIAAQGHKVLNLSVGEPDTPPPAWVKDAAIDAVTSNKHRYSPVAGLPQLRDAIIAKLQRENAIPGYTRAQTIVSTGAKQVLHNAFMVSVWLDQEVIIPLPYWVSYPSMVTMAGGKPVFAPCNEHFKVDSHTLEALITPKTRWFVLNSPSNPSGAVYDEAELRALAHVLKKNPHVWILCDDIYEHMIYDQKTFVSLLNVAPELSPRTLIVNGLSKSFSLTGWRLGYGVGPEPLIEAMIRLQSHATSGPCCLSQWAAIQALNDPQSAGFLQEQKQLFQRRRDLLVEGLDLPMTKPEGAFYAFIDVRPLLERTGLKDDMALAQLWLESLYVSCVPGSEFGMAGFMRLSYALDEEDLKIAMDRLNGWIKSPQL